MELELMCTREHVLNEITQVTEANVVHFISHQWLGNNHPDPDGTQLRRIQHVFGIILDGKAEGLFSETNWECFSTGVSRFVAKEAADAERRGLGSQRRGTTTFQRDIQDGYVWLDFLSVPQLTGREDSLKIGSELAGAAVDMEATISTASDSLQSNLAAVQSIPYYVSDAQYCS
jgi:hypothetical protein